jgi:hypothetical protein
MIKTGPNLRYVNPARVDPSRENKLYMRSLVVKNAATLEVRIDGRLVKSVKKPHVQPSEMLTLSLVPADFAGAGMDAQVEISI